MKKFIIALFTICVFSAFTGAKQEDINDRMFDLDRAAQTTLSQALPELKKNKIILVGEHHSNERHHMAQLRVIQALVDAGVEVAVGLEMFRSDSQTALDRWVAEKIDEKSFQQIYYDNWNFPWTAYSMIFEYARRHRVPLLGLNVSREITRQVAEQGFQSLTPEQKGKLSDVTCRVDQEYMQFIKKAYGGHGHGHGKMDFTYFCEAQLVWDTVMAINAISYLKSNPFAVVVILSGTGHARKGAIPRQIRNRSDYPFMVLLPEVPGSIDAHTVSKKDADYIILDL